MRTKEELLKAHIASETLREEENIFMEVLLDIRDLMKPTLIQPVESRFQSSVGNTHEAHEKLFSVEEWEKATNKFSETREIEHADLTSNEDNETAWMKNHEDEIRADERARLRDLISKKMEVAKKLLLNGEDIKLAEEIISALK